MTSLRTYEWKRDHSELPEKYKVVNTFDLLEHVICHGFADPVRRFVVPGGTFYGGSAGATLASDNIGIAEAYDENGNGLTNLDGLGLTPGAT